MAELFRLADCGGKRKLFSLISQSANFLHYKVSLMLHRQEINNLETPLDTPSLLISACVQGGNTQLLS